LRFLILLLIGGGLTAALTNGDILQIFPVIRQTNVPEGSFIDPAPWQTHQFILMVGFILFNLIGIGITIALIMWLLDWGVRKGRAQASSGETKPVAAETAQER
jgi:hypothetical protein